MYTHVIRVRSPAKPFWRRHPRKGMAFSPSSAAIEFDAQFDSEFVLGSAVPHDRDLILGSHSVHTSTAALREAEARISAIQTRLIQQGRL
jgi:hypothetical protein